MELIATSADGTVAALAYGAVPALGGTRLRCGLLFVARGQQDETVEFTDLDDNNRIRVRLPPEVIGQKGNARINKIELEVV